jgi:DNA (cytosine-5)-methyltransferase 1
VNVLDLFSGIGGFSLGLERAGMTTVAFCEVDPYARRVLAKHWPSVPCYGDIRELTAAQLGADGISADVICGGFPCQDISVAGLQKGITGERSGLWAEIARLVREIRPKFVLVENVAALLFNGLGDVLRDISALGYDAEWHCIPASAVGAPHGRDRVWILAYPLEVGSKGGKGLLAEGFSRQLGRGDCNPGRYWSREPRPNGVAHGVSNQLDRLARCGNAVVPQIPEMIGRAIMAANQIA